MSNSKTEIAPRLTVAIAGASGFVGRALRPVLARSHTVVGLSRGRPPGVDDDGVQWRNCDLYSLLDAEKALQGADVAVYLVHSMLPSARLTQASFEDTDLILADNFARAAAAANVRQIIYLGGLIPTDTAPDKLSRHLDSRLEVERALGAYGVPVTALRAGMVIGAGGSSLDMLLKLVRRLPLMLTPKWTRSQTQCIALSDVVELIDFAVGEPRTYGQAFDVGAPEVTQYRDLMRITAEVLGKPARMFNVPFFSPGLSKLWVSLISGQPRALVSPLVESLKHNMVARDLTLQEMAGQSPTPLRTALADAIKAEAVRTAVKTRTPKAKRPQPAPDVRSIQRLSDPGIGDADWVTDEYMRWLPRFCRPFVHVEQDGVQMRFCVPKGPCLLVLTKSTERSSPDRALLYITGGMLTRVDETGNRRGRLEFRQVAGEGVYLAAIHDFSPRLPWWFYTVTQAKAHLLVMRAFERHLNRLKLVAQAPHDADRAPSDAAQ